jgi:hypothetical protein
MKLIIVCGWVVGKTFSAKKIHSFLVWSDFIFVFPEQTGKKQLWPYSDFFSQFVS